MRLKHRLKKEKDMNEYIIGKINITSIVYKKVHAASVYSAMCSLDNVF